MKKMIDPLLISKMKIVEKRGLFPWSKQYGIDIYTIDGNIHYEKCSSKEWAGIVMSEYAISAVILNKMLQKRP